MKKLKNLLIYLAQFVLPAKFFFKDVSEETVVITGAGSGIGRLLALKLSALGAKLALIDVNEEGLWETSRRIAQLGNSCNYYVCDISKKENVYKCTKMIKKDHDFISMLINNAGIAGSGRRYMEMDDEKLVKTMEVNALSHVWMVKSFLPKMKEKNHGHIVTISSYAGVMGSVALGDYCASKSAASTLAESLALEMYCDGYDGIHSTIVCPFVINTGLFQGASLPTIPNMDPERAANDILASILTNHVFLILPKYMWLCVFIKTLLPWGVSFAVYQFLSGHTLMDGFTGRQKKRQVDSANTSNNNETKMANKSS